MLPSRPIFGIRQVTHVDRRIAIVATFIPTERVLTGLMPGRLFPSERGTQVRWVCGSKLVPFALPCISKLRAFPQFADLRRYHAIGAAGNWGRVSRFFFGGTQTSRDLFHAYVPLPMPSVANDGSPTANSAPQLGHVVIHSKFTTLEMDVSNREYLGAGAVAAVGSGSTGRGTVATTSKLQPKNDLKAHWRSKSPHRLCAHSRLLAAN